MAKSREAFRTISEVSEWLSIPTHVLRFWESRFKQIKPVKRAGGRRYYRPNDMLLLGGIRRLLHDDGITIKGVQKILREKGVKHVNSLCLEALDDLSFVEETPAQPPAPDLKPEVPEPDESQEGASTGTDPAPAALLDIPGAPEIAHPAPRGRAPDGGPGDVILPRPDVIAVAEIDKAARTDRIIALYQRLQALRDRVAQGMPQP